jgi:hypothetical protein
MNKIAGNDWDNGCVAVAVSTMRCVLGYRTALPNGFSKDTFDDGMKTEDLARNASKLFPKHRVSVWCAKELSDGVDGYMGSHWEGEGFKGNYITMFDYRSRTDQRCNGHSHMVVGHPTIYDGMSTTIIVRVEM